MIIDVHYHSIPYSLPAERINMMIEEWPMRIAKIMGIEVQKEILIPRAQELWGDLDGSKMIKLMNESGIDFTVICNVDNSTIEGATVDKVQEINKRVGNIAKEYPDRVMALAGVDPRRLDALEMLKQCFEEFGIQGLKFHGDHGYYPNGPESYKLLDYLEKNNGVLLTHTGPIPPPSRPKFAEPIELSDIGVDFPNLKVIAAHMGLINWRPWAALAASQPNLYGDLAMWSPYAYGKFKLFCRELRDIIDYAGVEKILFGSDCPIYDVVLPVKDFIAIIKSLPKKAPKGINFTNEEIDAILGNNAAKFLGLDEIKSIE
ncbi:MAG: amidohydrolase [Promethearchaeota archaeon]|nr:MAG: amidohydrolase [Candidatus Lokiarchaeota archaeon]